jgi:uncharacterized membrane protein
MKKTSFLIAFLVPVFQPSFACVTCNRPLQERILGEDLLTNLLLMLAPLAFAMLAAAMVSYTAGSTISTTAGNPPSGPAAPPALTVRPLASAGIVLGIGLGGFLDGIFLHQILQWHQMLSAQVAPVTVPDKNLNMFWDGIFHAFTWMVTFTGIIMLYRLQGRREAVRSSRVFAGGLLLGWALFNFAEGLIDHYIYGLHNVRENVENPQFYNHAFMLFSLVLAAAGLLLIARGKRLAGLQ